MKKIRFKCPCCGMVSDFDRLKYGPHKITVYSQEFGGKVAGDHKGRGRASGLMKYTNITRSSNSHIDEVKEMLRKTYQNIEDQEKSRLK